MCLCCVHIQEPLVHVGIFKCMCSCGHIQETLVHTRLYVCVFVVTSRRPWCTCMFVCAHMVISGRPWCTYISVCVCVHVRVCMCVCAHMVIFERPWCTHVFVCVHAHVVTPRRPWCTRMSVCMHARVLTSRTDKSSAEMGLPVLDAQSQSVFTSCLTPLQFHQAPRRRSNRERAEQAPEVIWEPGMSTTGSGAKVGENRLHKNPDVRGGCMGVPGAGLAPVGPISRVVTSRQRDRSPLGSPPKTSSLDWGAHGQLCSLGGHESLENTAHPPPTPPES